MGKTIEERIVELIKEEIHKDHQEQAMRMLKDDILSDRLVARYAMLPEEEVRELRKQISES